MTRRLAVVIAAVLPFSALLIAGIAGLFFLPYAGTSSLSNITLVPEVAVRHMLRVPDNGLRDFHIVADQAWGWRRLLVYEYVAPPSYQPAHGEFGYALVEWRLGWSAIPGTIVGEASPSNLVAYASEQLDHNTIVYGIALDARVRMIEVSSNNGYTQRTQVMNGGFLVVFRGNATVRTLQALDAQGQVLQTYTTPNLYGPSYLR